MLKSIAAECDYNLRAARLGLNFLRRSFIHCNLQVTYRCGFTCSICDFWREHHAVEDELDLDQITMVARKLRRFGTLIVSLAGGEPLVRQDLPEIARIFARAGHFPILITNGWHVTEDKAHALFEAGLQEISVSVDYRDPARHDAMRGCPGAWGRAIEALRILQRTRPSRRRRVHMISVLLDDNLDEVEPLIELSRELGVTYMVNLYSCNRGCKAARLPDEPIAARLLELKRRHPEFISLTSYLERFDHAIATGGIGNCRAGRLLLNIGSRGDVARCTETLDRSIGNILHVPAEELRRRLGTRVRDERCAACWTSCRGFAESMFTRPRGRQLREFLVSVKPR